MTTLTEAFELVMPDEAARKRYLEDLFAGARPGFGHRVLGGLLVAGYCEALSLTGRRVLLGRLGGGLNSGFADRYQELSMTSQLQAGDGRCDSPTWRERRATTSTRFAMA